MNKFLRNWGFELLTPHKHIDAEGKLSAFCIVYTATEHVELESNGQTVSLKPETFFFLPQNCSFSVPQPYEYAVLIWFTGELLANHPQLMYYINQSLLFQEKTGTAVDNHFLPYDALLKQYVSPLLNRKVNPIFKKNLLTNFIEFIIIRSLLESDPLLIENTQHQYEKEIASKFCHLVTQNGQHDITVEEYAEQLNMTKRSLDRAIQTVYGFSAKKFIDARITDMAKVRLRGSADPVKNISQDLGFSQESNFTIFFKKHTGLTPVQYREDGGDMLENQSVKDHA